MPGKFLGPPGETLLHPNPITPDTGSSVAVCHEKWVKLRKRSIRVAERPGEDAEPSSLGREALFCCPLRVQPGGKLGLPEPQFPYLKCKPLQRPAGVPSNASKAPT